jgi:hypothetical protein
MPSDNAAAPPAPEARSATSTRAPPPGRRARRRSRRHRSRSPRRRFPGRTNRPRPVPVASPARRAGREEAAARPERAAPGPTAGCPRRSPSERAASTRPHPRHRRLRRRRLALDVVHSERCRRNQRTAGSGARWRAHRHRARSAGGRPTGSAPIDPPSTATARETPGWPERTPGPARQADSLRHGPPSATRRRCTPVDRQRARIANGARPQ